MDDPLAHLLGNPLDASEERYALVRELGRGSMGVVYLGRDLVLDREVAVKVMAASLTGDAELRARLEREARAAGSLSHPNLVTVHDFGYEASGAPFVVMELLRGCDLRRALLQGEPQAVSRRVDVVLKVLAGLAHAHAAGIVHRDVKPANVFLTDEGGVKLLDFGIARVLRSSGSTGPAVIGTADYMSPEQVLGAAVDGRSDLFSCGSVLFELLTGVPPFHADDFLSIAYRVVQEEPDYGLLPAGCRRLEPVLRRALAKPLEQRYASAEEFAAHLDAATLELGGEAGAAAGARPPSPTWTQARPLPVFAPAGWMPRAPLPSRSPGLPGTSTSEAQGLRSAWPLARLDDEEGARSARPGRQPPRRGRLGWGAAAAGLAALPLMFLTSTGYTPVPAIASGTAATLPVPPGPARDIALPAPTPASTQPPLAARAAQTTVAAPAPAAGRWLGYLTDDQCRHKGAVPDHGRCLEICLAKGRRPLISIGGRLYDVAGFARIRGHHDRRVIVEGVLDEQAGLLTVHRGYPASR